MNYTLITGACKGIGKAIAHECASRGMNVLLVSNDSSCLQSVNDDIRKKGVDCHYLCVDLTDDNGPSRVREWMKVNQFRVNILINNVGIGKGGTFSSMNMDDMKYMMKLNNNVLVEMTYLL